MTFPSLLRKEVEDEYVLENFDRIQGHFKSSPLERMGFDFYRISIAGAVTNMRFPHGLSYIPTDIIVTKNSNNVAVTFNWSLFDPTFIDLTVAGATDLRLLIGRYEDN